MPTSLRRTMCFWDVVLFLVAAVVGLRWIASSAAAGPSSLVVWGIALAALFIPLAFTVIELSARYPAEGGLYVWIKRAFGDYAGFIAGWLYWNSNLVYLPGLLYFSAGNALFIGGGSWQSQAQNPAYFIAFSLTGLFLGFVLNLVGLGVGKWLHNAGGMGTWIPVVVLVGMGALALVRFGPASDFGGTALVPRVSLNEIIFWSTIAFGFSGLESASFMGEEIVDARRVLPRAILAAGAIIAGIYVLGTAAVLVALPPGEANNLQGIMQAIARTGERVGWPAAGPVLAVLITIGNLGGVGAWLASTARLPFVAGIDRALPPAFGRLHRRWQTPYVALLVQTGGTVLFVVLGQAGATVKEAYDVLVSLAIISNFVPFLLLFAAMIKLQREPAPPGVFRVPGGTPVAILLASLGFVVTATAIVLATIPPPEASDPTLSVVKVVGTSLALAVLGTVLYRFRRK